MVHWNDSDITRMMIISEKFVIYLYKKFYDDENMLIMDIPIMNFVYILKQEFFLSVNDFWFIT